MCYFCVTFWYNRKLLTELRIRPKKEVLLSHLHFLNLFNKTINFYLFEANSYL